MLVISSICAVIILFSPYETLGRALDFSTEETKDGKDTNSSKESKDEEKVQLINNFKIL